MTPKQLSEFVDMTARLLKRTDERIEKLETEFKGLSGTLGSIVVAIGDSLGEDTKGVALPDGCTYMGLSDPGRTYREKQVVFVRGTGFMVLMLKPDDSFEWVPYAGQV